ncbi:hypothetical protein [Ferruginibacter sp. SUN106]|uniref:hypothetical protein n=1 Tax=Ferruginibacter sp. SUN106 TaxID=2978348 RepID=UPI003D36B563
MFIKKLYRYSKVMFFVFIAFVISFLFINYKWGLVATPVFEYGMFAGKFYLKDTQTVYTVVANDKMINNAAISFTERDVIQIYIERYQKYKTVNAEVYATMKKYVGYTGLASFMQHDKFNPAIADTTFTNWYKEKIKAIAGVPVTSLKVYEQHYVWQNGVLAAIDTPFKLTCIVP